MKKFFSILLIVIVSFASFSGALASNDSYFRASNQTELTGRFFTTLWGASVSDIDVQEMIHGYKLTVWDSEIGKYRLNHTVVSGASSLLDKDNNKTYYFSLYKDLKYSNGEEITAKDYVFSFLFQMDPVILETHGIPMNYSWIIGADEYLNGEVNYVSGIRIINTHMFSIAVKADALPWFYELSRFSVSPYPCQYIAPYSIVSDSGNGATIMPRLTVETLRTTVLDSFYGYMTKPSATSGAYILTDYRNGEAYFDANPYYKGDENGNRPVIQKIVYSGGKNNQIEHLNNSDLDLVSKVLTKDDTILAQETILSSVNPRNYTAKRYPRAGQAVLRFTPESSLVQDQEVRKALLLCFDREGFRKHLLGENYTEVGLLNNIYGELVKEEINKIPQSDYVFDVNRATSLLVEAGWNSNSTGNDVYTPDLDACRYKIVDDSLLKLSLKVAVPANMISLLDEYWAVNLKNIGINVEFIETGMNELISAYQDVSNLKVPEDTKKYDIVFIGNDNYPSNILIHSVNPESDSYVAPLIAINNKLNSMVWDMNKTEPDDIESFVSKWLDMQSFIDSEVPFIFLYTGSYCDYYISELKGYDIDKFALFGDAIQTAWIKSD